MCVCEHACVRMCMCVCVFVSGWFIMWIFVVFRIQHPGFYPTLLLSTEGWWVRNSWLSSAPIKYSLYYSNEYTRVSQPTVFKFKFPEYITSAAASYLSVMHFNIMVLVSHNIFLLRMLHWWAWPMFFTGLGLTRTPRPSSTYHLRFARELLSVRWIVHPWDT